MNKFNLGDKVKHPCDSDAFEVVGIRENEVEIKGDWSGGTHPCNQAGWVPINEVEPYDETKVVYYINGKPYRNGAPMER